MNGVQRYLYTSSACVYPEFKQTDANVAPLKEEDAYPAQPQDAYGWEKLVTERLCTHYREDYGIETRIVRFHNIFGPLGTWDGGREKAPAAMCRKVAMAKLTGNPEIEIWGDGEQTRSFCYIDDCVEGIDRLMRSDFREPLNLGQDRMVTINQLADMVAEIAGVRIVKKHVSGPRACAAATPTTRCCARSFSWEPEISLEEGPAHAPTPGSNSRCGRRCAAQRRPKQPSPLPSEYGGVASACRILDSESLKNPGQHAESSSL